MATSNPVRKSEKKLRQHVLKHGDVKDEKYLELVNNIVHTKLQEEQKFYHQVIRDAKLAENSRISALTDNEILEEDFEKNAEANAIANAVNSLIIATEKNALRNKKKNKKKKEKAKAKKKKMMEARSPKDILPCLDTVLARIETLEKMDGLD
jgi:hypothetical protein